VDQGFFRIGMIFAVMSVCRRPGARRPAGGRRCRFPILNSGIARQQFPIAGNRPLPRPRARSPSLSSTTRQQRRAPFLHISVLSPQQLTSLPLRMEKYMSTKPGFTRLAAVAAMSCAGLLAAPAYAAVDAAAAEALARQNGCLKCHGIDKKKDGPAYRDVAAKFKGKTDADARLITHITTGEKAKFPDGHEEDHKIIKTKDMGEIKNLVQWILSL
jgi:cytochrome c